jgi:enoyl-CoA hydratase/carnithine racemase
LNALCDELIKELNNALNKFDNDEEVAAIILTGSEKVFAGTIFFFIIKRILSKLYLKLFFLFIFIAGADISEMLNQTFESVHKTRMF